MVRRDDGLVRLGPHLGWVDEPLGARAAGAGARRGGRTVAVGNVADLCALAEHTRGVAVGCDNVIYLYGDVGVGARHHRRRPPGHRPRRLRRRGRPHGGQPARPPLRLRLPRLLGDRDRRARAAARRRPRTTAPASEAVLAVVDAAARGDAAAQAAVRQVGDWLGFGVANLVNIFNPEMVIFGGTLRDVYLAAAAQVRSRLNSDRPARLPRARPAAHARSWARTPP